jgi:N-acetyl-anhydromuramyl-L-alanine amidase AmpD
MGDIWILPKYQRITSPNIWSGRAGVQVDTLVIHYAVDGDDFERGENEHARFEALNPSHDVTDVAKLFARESRGASAHFVIGRDGSLVQCVALDDTAWHAGGGALPDEGVGPLERPRSRLVNRRSIGIELCNAGWAADRIGVPREYIREAIHPANARRRKVQRWEVFRDAQYEVLDELLAMIRPHFVVDREVFVVGHEDVVNRDTTGGGGGKVDPGPLWDWTRNSWRRFGYFPLRYDFKRQHWVGRDVRKLEEKETEG